MAVAPDTNQEEGFTLAEFGKLVRDVMERYISSRRSTPAHQLKVRLGKRRWILDNLASDEIIRIEGEKVFPRFRAATALEPELQNRVRQWTALVLRALRQLYVTNGPRLFGSGEVFGAARAIDPTVEPEMIDVGMLLATEFSLFCSGWSISQEDVIMKIGVKDAILDFESLEAAWAGEQGLRQAAKAQSTAAVRQDSSREPVSVATPEARDLSFVADIKLQTIIDRDYAELQRVGAVSVVKSRFILAGGLIEALLLDALQRNEAQARNAKSAERKPLDEWSLGSLIDVAVELGLVGAGAQSFGHAVREYRNLVHPGKEKRSKYAVAPEEADIAEKVLDIVIRDLRDRAGKAG